MKVGDTVKLKPAMWQGIKPESYGLSFSGEYVIEQYIDMQYPAIKLEGFTRKWDAHSFQLVVKEKEKEVESKSSLDVQVGGSHYKDKGIQPVEYCYQNNLGFLESNVVKYVSRHKDKNKADDIKKAIHYCKFILEFEYGIIE